jgi:hypothetical protein
MNALSVVRAPSVSLSSTTFSSPSISVSTPSVSVGTSAPKFLTGTAPDLSLRSISAPSLSITNPISSPASLNLSGIGQTMGVPTSIGGAASGLGVPTSIGGAASSLGIPTSLPPVGDALKTLGFNASMPKLDLSLTGLNFPKLPEFPGIDLAGINLGAGPKFIAEQIAKYKSIVPPFVPGLKINMGMALAAVSVIKAAMSANPSELLKHLLSSVLDDIKGQALGQLQTAIDSTGVNNIQGQLNSVVGGAKDSFLSNFNTLNPPQTTTNEDGETIEIPAPKPDLSGFPDVSNIAPKVGEGILATSNIKTSQFTSTAGSTLKSFTFPPTG